MQFRVMTLNFEQDHKRGLVRRSLILDEIGRRKPDLMALNERACRKLFPTSIRTA